MTTLLISAGDASGDLHAADFVRSFRKLRPETRFVGLGGDEMERAGVELVVHQRDLAVGGLLELFGSIPRIAAAWRRLGEALIRLRPALVVLVDSGGFNLPFARRVRRVVDAKILYFVAPQVWAWRRGRIPKLARRVDRMAVIFPFEPEIYRGTSLRVDYVGHPLVEKLTSLAAQIDCAAARAIIGVDENVRLVTLFPGSRRNEIREQLPVQLAAARWLQSLSSSAQFVICVVLSRLSASSANGSMCGSARPCATERIC
jgi:lipid-A-disaccharide synthase